MNWPILPLSAWEQTGTIFRSASCAYRISLPRTMRGSCAIEYELESPSRFWRQDEERGAALRARGKTHDFSCGSLSGICVADRARLGQLARARNFCGAVGAARASGRGLRTALG